MRHIINRATRVGMVVKSHDQFITALSECPINYGNSDDFRPVTQEYYDNEVLDFRYEDGVWLQ